MLDISIENVISLNKPLNNFELEDAARKIKIPSFRGFFSTRYITKKPSKEECDIVNLDKSGGPCGLV